MTFILNICSHVPSKELICDQFGGEGFIVKKGLLPEGDFLTINAQERSVKWYRPYTHHYFRKFTFSKTPLDAVFCLMRMSSAESNDAIVSADENLQLAVAVLLAEQQLQIHLESGEKFELLLPIAVNGLYSTPSGLLLESNSASSNHGQLPNDYSSSNNDAQNKFVRQTKNIQFRHFLLSSPYSPLSSVTILVTQEGIKDFRIIAVHDDLICFVRSDGSSAMICCLQAKLTQSDSAAYDGRTSELSANRSELSGFMSNSMIMERSGASETVNHSFASIHSANSTNLSHSSGGSGSKMHSGNSGATMRHKQSRSTPSPTNPRTLRLSPHADAMAMSGTTSQYDSDTLQSLLGLKGNKHHRDSNRSIIDVKSQASSRYQLHSYPSPLTKEIISRDEPILSLDALSIFPSESIFSEERNQSEPFGILEFHTCLNLPLVCNSSDDSDAPQLSGRFIGDRSYFGGLSLTITCGYKTMKYFFVGNQENVDNWASQSSKDKLQLAVYKEIMSDEANRSIIAIQTKLSNVNSMTSFMEKYKSDKLPLILSCSKSLSSPVVLNPDGKPLVDFSDIEVARDCSWSDLDSPLNRSDKSVFRACSQLHQISGFSSYFGFNAANDEGTYILSLDRRYGSRAQQNVSRCAPEVEDDALVILRRVLCDQTVLLNIAVQMFLRHSRLGVETQLLALVGFLALEPNFDELRTRLSSFNIDMALIAEAQKEIKDSRIPQTNEFLWEFVSDLADLMHHYLLKGGASNVQKFGLLSSFLNSVFDMFSAVDSVKIKHIYSPLQSSADVMRAYLQDITEKPLDQAFSRSFSQTKFFALLVSKFSRCATAAASAHSYDPRCSSPAYRLIDAFVQTVMAFQAARPPFDEEQWQSFFNELPIFVRKTLQLAFTQCTEYVNSEWPPIVLKWLGRADLYGEQVFIFDVETWRVCLFCSLCAFI